MKYILRKYKRLRMQEYHQLITAFIIIFMA